MATVLWRPFSELQALKFVSHLAFASLPLSLPCCIETIINAYWFLPSKYPL